MFGIFKKRIPAPEPERRRLAARLFMHRFESDPAARMLAASFGQDPREAADQVMDIGFPECSILGAVEQYLLLRDEGATPPQAVAMINEAHAAQLHLLGREELELLPAGADLFKYIRHLLNTLHGHGTEVSDEFLDYAVREITQFYHR